MFTLTPVQYVEWLIAVHGYTDDEAAKRVESVHFKQTGRSIRLFLRPYKDEMIWDYLENTK